MRVNRKTALALARNLTTLMDHFDLSQKELERKAGVGQRTISTLLNLTDPASINPRADTLDKLALAFNVPAWQLLIPDLPLELLLSHQLTKLVENYRDAPERGRESVDRIAESEVRYAIAVGKDKLTGTN